MIYCRLAAWFRWPCAHSLLLAVAAACLGCGGSGPSNVGQISGRVTLDDQPLDGALVTFAPVQPGGSTAVVRTDSNGRYASEVEVGEHVVSIVTYSAGNPDSDPPRPSVPEKVPVKYNYKTELKADVKSGSSTLDWPLKSDGPIMAKPPEAP